MTSGAAVVAPGQLATEDTPPLASSDDIPRASEQAALAAATAGARVAIVRLAPSVHGRGDHGFVPMLIAIARQKSSAGMIGEGGNRWPAVHRLDAAQLFRLVLEKGKPGALYNSVAEQGVAFRDIAGVIARRLNVPVVSKEPSEAADHFGWFAHFAGLDIPTSSVLTQQTLGWSPRHPGLIADIDQEYYFEA